MTLTPLLIDLTGAFLVQKQTGVLSDACLWGMDELFINVFLITISNKMVLPMSCFVNRKIKIYFVNLTKNMPM